MIIDVSGTAPWCVLTLKKLCWAMLLQVLTSFPSFVSISTRTQKWSKSLIGLGHSPPKSSVTTVRSQLTWTGRVYPVTRSTGTSPMGLNSSWT